MNSRQVEVFKAIMECGSITRAADVLFVSQPAVTKSLQLLEHSLGLKLFTRTPKGLVPTSVARAFYTEVERSFIGLAHLRDYAGELRSLKHERLRVSVIPALSDRWLPQVLVRFLDKYPDASLSFQAASSPHTAQLVGQRQIDLGIAQSRIEDVSMERTLLFSLEAVCIMPANHPLTAEAVITPAHLHGQVFVSLSRQDIITIQLQRALDEAGVKVSRQVEVSLGASVRELVGLGFGIGIVDWGTVMERDDENFVIRPFRPRLEMPIYLLRMRDRPASLIEQRFIDQMVEHAPAIAAL